MQPKPFTDAPVDLLTPSHLQGEKKGISRRRLMQAALGVGAVAALPAVYESENLSIEHHRLPLPNWTAGKVRVAVLSDFHMREQYHVDRSVRALEMVVPYRPDFLLLPGDFIEGIRPESLALLQEFLSHVSELSFPAIASFGNHDTVSPQTIWSLQAFDAAKIPLLQNEMLDFGGVLFVGFEDGLNGEPRPELFGSDVAPRNVIALMHEPGVVERMPSQFSLQVSGHTHGGQVCLPGGFSLYRPRLSGHYVEGYYPKAPIPLYISRGIGTTGLPFRAYCRPEVTILDLEPG
jgi:predicted MPP superfamily phosphohydrolase